MLRIGLLSDTHGYIHPRVFEVFKECDEIWHAGDIGDPNIISDLSQIAPVRAVYGNIDGQDIMMIHPEVQAFQVEEVKVLMIHIGGYPGKYEKKSIALIRNENPDLFITGHSHILKVIYDEKNKLLHINPGAAGIFGMHQKITLVRFILDGKDIRDLEVIEYDRRYPKPHQM
jgi:putative phosphoesterase